MLVCLLIAFVQEPLPNESNEYCEGLKGGVSVELMERTQTLMTQLEANTPTDAREIAFKECRYLLLSHNRLGMIWADGPVEARNHVISLE